MIKHYKCSKCGKTMTSEYTFTYIDPVSGIELRFHKLDNGLVQKISISEILFESGRWE